jgi:hypothetical protein
MEANEGGAAFSRFRIFQAPKPGTNVMICEIFLPKNWSKNWYYYPNYSCSYRKFGPLRIPPFVAENW